MSPLIRGILGLALVAGLTSAGLFLFSEPADDVVRSEDVAETTSWQSSRQCLPCHQDVWDEWHGTQHQGAYLNPEVRKLSDDFRNKECQACHLPQPVAVTGYAQRTLPRQTRPDEGVGCITCHLSADGRILGRHANPDAACKPVASPELISVAQCESCHNQHETTDQWRATHFAAENVSCNDCHMPEVTRQLAGGGTRTGFSHVYPAAHDLDMLRKAGEFDARIEGGELVLSLVNKAAGHNFPTEERSRALDMVYRFVNADGVAGEWTRAYRFRAPYRDEPGEDTQLRSGKSHEERIPVPADAVVAEARLWYRRQPYIGDDHPDSVLLFEREVREP